MNTPKLRFKKFTDEWILTNLESISSNITAGKSKISQSKTQLYPILGSTGVIGYADTYDYDGNFILIARVGANAGKITSFNGKCNITDNTIFFESTKSEKDFLIELLKKQDLSKKSFGSGQPLVKASDLKSLKILIPSLEEQYKMGAFFNKINSKIQLQQEKIDLLKEQKKGYMQKIFSQELRFKDVDGKEYPTWKKAKLGKLTKKAGKKNSEGVKYPVAAISNKKGFTLEGDRNYSNADVDIRTYKLVHKNEFAYNPSRINVGSFGFQNVADVAIVSSLYVIFETLPPLSNAYLKSYMHSRYFNQDVIRNTEGSVREYLFYENFSNINIPLPCIKEQEKITEFLSKLECKTQLEEQKLESLQQQKLWFIQQMFTIM